MRLTMKQRQADTAGTVQRYRNGSKKIKQQILDEICEDQGLLPWLLRASGKRMIVGDVRRRQQRQKPRYYNEAVGEQLIKLWELLTVAANAW